LTTIGLVWKGGFIDDADCGESDDARVIPSGDGDVGERLHPRVAERVVPPSRQTAVAGRAISSTTTP
jgi:hypothetical protein